MRLDNGAYGAEVVQPIAQETVSEFMKLPSREMAAWIGVTQRNARRYRHGLGDQRKLRNAIKAWEAAGKPDKKQPEWMSDHERVVS